MVDPRTVRGKCKRIFIKEATVLGDNPAGGHVQPEIAVSRRERRLGVRDRVLAALELGRRLVSPLRSAPPTRSCAGELRLQPVEQAVEPVGELIGVGQ